MVAHVQFLSPTVPDELMLLGIAFVLCGILGIERQLSQKSAGVRTHLLVGLGAAGFTLVSAYGFRSVSSAGAMVDPTRISAQIVSGIGFLGAGVIFIRRDVVKGLTTAATIWVTAAVGMACGAGLVILACALTALHLIAVVFISPLVRRLPRASDRRTLIIHYQDGQGVLRKVLAVATEMGYQTRIHSTRQFKRNGQNTIYAQMEFLGRPPLQTLMAELSELVGVERVSSVEESV